MASLDNGTPSGATVLFGVEAADEEAALEAAQRRLDRFAQPVASVRALKLSR